MKKIVVFAACLGGLNLYAQKKAAPQAAPKSDCSKLTERISALKQDSAFIHEKLAFYEKMNADTEYRVTGFSSQFDVKVLSCQGDRGAQTVRVEFVIKHRRVNQLVYIENSSAQTNAYDEIGNMFEVSESTLGSKRSGGCYYTTTIPTDIDVRGTVTFKRVIGGTEGFKLVNIYVGSRDFDGETNKIEGVICIKNLKINW